MTNDQIETGRLTQADIWKHKEKFFEKAEQSRQVWGDMQSEQQEALLAIVDRALIRFRDTVDAWLPESLTLVNGEYVEVTFRVLFTELDEEMRRREDVTERSVARAAEEIQETLREFELEQ